jgi:tetratricopeptide (TPR) repeat protein
VGGAAGDELKNAEEKQTLSVKSKRLFPREFRRSFIPGAAGAAALIAVFTVGASRMPAQATAPQQAGKRTPIELLQTAHTLFLQRDYEAAREYYQEVLPSFPQNFDILKNLAYCYYRRGPKGYAQAASYYSQAYKINPNSAEVVDNLGICLVELNRAAEAGALYQKLAEQPDGPSSAWKRAGEAYALADRIPQAEQCYDAYLQRNPGDLDARTRLGDLYVREKNYNRGQEQYRIVLTTNPDYSRALLGMARLAAWQDQREESLRLYDRVLKQDPSNGEALTGKAFVLLWLGRYEESQALFLQLSQRYPRDADISRGLGQSEAALRQKELTAARSAGDAARVEALFRDRLQKDPKDVTALRALAEATATPARCSESVSFSRRALEAAPGDSATELRLARSLALCQQFAEAATQYNRILQSNPKSQEALTELGSALLRARRNTEAVEAFRKALQLNPRNTDAGVGLALALSAAGNHDEALQHYNEVLKISPDHYDALQGKAFALFWNGQLDASRAIFQALAARQPNDSQNKVALQNIAAAEEEAKWVAARPGPSASPQEFLTYYDHRLAARPDDLEALKGRAYIQSQLNNFPAAIRDYRQVLERTPDDQAVKKELARLLARETQYDAAIRLYQEVLRDSPADTDTLENLARVYVWSKHDREALATYQTLLAQNPSNTGYQMEAARLQLRLQDDAGARKSLNAVLAADPSNREARLGLAQLDDRHGDRAAALRGYDEVLKQNPQDTSALLGKARIAYYQGKTKDAHAAASQVVQAEPNNFDAVFLLASIEHSRGHGRPTKEFLNRAEQISPNNPEVVAMRQRLREERAITIHTTTSFAREIGPAGEATVGAARYTNIGILTDAATKVVVDNAGVPVPIVFDTVFDETTATGLPNEDVRYQAYGVTIGVPLSPQLNSYFSFTSLPTQSPTPSIQGAVAPFTFVSRFSWRPSRYLTVRGGAGLTRFGPADIQRLPDLAGDFPNLVDRFGPSVTDGLGVTPTTVPGQGVKPVGLAGATIAPSQKFSIDLDWNRGPAINYPTPRAMKLHLIQTRFDGTLNFYFTPRTELHFNMFYANLSTDSNLETSNFTLMDPAAFSQAFTPYTAIVETQQNGTTVQEERNVNVPVPGPLFSAWSAYQSALHIDPLYYPSSGVGTCPAVTLDPLNLVVVQSTNIGGTGLRPLCAIGEVTTHIGKATDWGHGGAITFNQKIIQSERFSLDGGYLGTAYGFAGQRINVRPRVFLGFFNPPFYQNHMLTGRIYGKLYGPVDYSLFGALGLQQTDHIDDRTLTSVSGPLTRSSKVTPSFSIKVSPNLTIGIAYTHYNTAQVLGPLRGNVVSLTSDWKF